MRALTVRQPCASCIALGLKPVENRSQPVPSTIELPALIAIHAGLRNHDRCWTRLRHTDRMALSEAGHLPTLPAGQLVATAVLAGYHHADDCLGIRHCDHWAEPNMWHWELEDAQPVADPLPMRGRLGLWRLPDDLAHQLTKERTP